MPYQKTKEGRLVNEVTLGDGYPLSNDKQPLKVGGEASIINVSSPTPDGSVDGEVEVKGNFKAKDTQVEGNFSATSIEGVPQFRFHSRNNISARLDVQASANQTASIRIRNNQGYFDIKRLYSSTSLQFTDGTNTPLSLEGDNVQFTNLTDGSITIDSFVDEDNMSSNSATKIPTQQSVKAYVDNEVAGLVDSAPAALDTLNELAAALNDDASFSTTITNSLALKAPLAAPAFTGNATFDSTTLAIDATNNRVGIGTESPDETLHVAGDVKVVSSSPYPSLLLESSGASANFMRFTTTDGTFSVGQDYDDNFSIANAANITSNRVFTILKSNGNVGIGTTSPQSSLHVDEGDIRIDTAQNGTQALRFSDRNGTEGQLQYNSQYLKLRMLTDAADGTDTKRLTVLGGQDATAVGIGTDDPTTTLDVEGTVSYKHTAFSTAGPTDNIDVSDTTVLEVDTSGGNVVIGGFTGGVQGQILYIVKTDTANFIQLEHNEGGGSQDIFLTTGSDERVVGYGGYTLYCNGTSWFSLSNPTGGADAG